MAMSEETKEQLATLAQSLLEKDPREFKRLAKKHHPELVTPELDVEDKIDETNKSWEEKYNTLEEKFKALEGKINVSRTRGDLEKKGYTNEQVAEIEELITSKKVSDYATAEELYSSRQRSKLAEPSNGRPFSPRRAQEPGLTEDKLKRLKEDPISFAKEEAMEAINDLRSGKVKLGQGGLTA